MPVKMADEILSDISDFIMRLLHSDYITVNTVYCKVYYMNLIITVSKIDDNIGLSC